MDDFDIGPQIDEHLEAEYEGEWEDDFPLYLEYPGEEPMFQHSDGFGYNFEEEWGE